MTGYHAYMRNGKRLQKLALAVGEALEINMREADGGSWYGLLDLGCEGRCPLKIRVADHGNQTNLGHYNSAAVQFIAAAGKKVPNRQEIRDKVAAAILAEGRAKISR